MPVEDGRAAWFERGVLWHPNGSGDVLTGIIDPPTLGHPLLIDFASPGSLHWISFSGAVAALDARPNLAATLFKRRLSLAPVVGGEPLPLSPSELSSSGDTRALSLTIDGYGPRRHRFAIDPGEISVVGDFKPKLTLRTLYSLAFMESGMGPRVISPHCLYTRAEWQTFGMAHITDIHVSRRIEKYRTLLRTRGISAENVARLNHWNDDFRAFIRYANQLHGEGRLDVIIATGDLVDYARELGDHPDGPGNFGFFESLVRGEAPGPDSESPPSEPLRVPIFTSLGNHDYRESPYALAFKIVPTSGDLLGDIPGVGDVLKDVVDAVEDTLVIPDIVGIATDYYGGRIDQFKSLNLLPNEAAAIMGLKDGDSYGIPELRPDAAAPGVRVDKRMRDGTHYYFRRINPSSSYVISLGGHRVVMLDTRWDAEMPDTTTELIAAAKGVGSESEVNFVTGTPDSIGVQKGELNLLREVITAAGANIVVVGMHAPPLNPSNTDVANFLRETVHPSTAVDQLMGWLLRNGAHSPVTGRSAKDDPNPKNFPKWTATGTTHFHEGPLEDNLDYGIAVGRQEEFAKILCGGDGGRPVTLVCSGHGHNRIEYRLKWDSEKRRLLAFTDHYLSNPLSYYPCRIVEGSWKDTDNHKRYLIRIEPGAPAEGRVENRTDYDGTIWNGAKELVVAPFATPLDQATDAAAWWQQYAPIVTQSAALGPCVNTRASKTVNEHAPGPNFQGFRLLHIDRNCIQKADYILFEQILSSTRAITESKTPPAPKPSIRDHRKPRLKLWQKVRRKPSR